jgi:hypothetical protein
VTFSQVTLIISRPQPLNYLHTQPQIACCSTGVMVARSLAHPGVGLAIWAEHEYRQECAGHNRSKLRLSSLSERLVGALSFCSFVIPCAVRVMELSVGYVNRIERSAFCNGYSTESEQSQSSSSELSFLLMDRGRRDLTEGGLGTTRSAARALRVRQRRGSPV